MSDAASPKKRDADDGEARKAFERRQRAWLHQVRSIRRRGAGPPRTRNPGLLLAVQRSNRRVMRVSVAQSLPRVVQQDAGLGEELLRRLERTALLPPRPRRGSEAESDSVPTSLKSLQVSRSAPQLRRAPQKRPALQASRRLRPAPSAPRLAPLRNSGPAQSNNPESRIRGPHGPPQTAGPAAPVRRPCSGETAVSGRRRNLGQSLLAIEKGTTAEEVARVQEEERSVAMKAFERPLKLLAVPITVRLKYGSAAVLQHELSGRYLTCLPSGAMALAPSPVGGSLLHVRTAFRCSPPPLQAHCCRRSSMLGTSMPTTPSQSAPTSGFRHQAAASLPTCPARSLPPRFREGGASPGRGRATERRTQAYPPQRMTQSTR